MTLHITVSPLQIEKEMKRNIHHVANSNGILSQAQTKIVCHAPNKLV